MPTIWRCTGCSSESDIEEVHGWWEWVGRNVDGFTYTFHYCPVCWGEKFIKQIALVEDLGGKE